MITVTIVRGAHGRIRRFTVSGHARYDDPGKDIVCAGVSAVTVGTVNAIEKLTGAVPRAVARSGWLSAECPDDADEHKVRDIQLLLEGMVVQLESIADEYGKFVRIKTTIDQEGG